MKAIFLALPICCLEVAAFQLPHQRTSHAPPSSLNHHHDTRQPHRSISLASTVGNASEAQTTNAPPKQSKHHEHTLAILTMPHSASARIANEAILERAIAVTSRRLSVVLRTNTGGTQSRTGEDYSNVSLTKLRRYAGEIYR
jgi:hypothetical protein